MTFTGAIAWALISDDATLNPLLLAAVFGACAALSSASGRLSTVFEAKGGNQLAVTARTWRHRLAPEQRDAIRDDVRRGYESTLRNRTVLQVLITAAAWNAALALVPAGITVWAAMNDRLNGGIWMTDIVFGAVFAYRVGTHLMTKAFIDRPEEAPAL
ncbi:hypothetical protein [Agromyces humi]|uniref:hypothetical protein n=1 Tax=Agromyces humi TaxID=1766800 RepID=UPI0013578F73|nr:hypothetical protein [Agromyces humi]